jgi:uncharacterized RmlC-like cupin family protein
MEDDFMTKADPKWRNDGIRIVRHDQLDLNVPSWPDIQLGAAITHASAGARKIWAGAVNFPPKAQTGPHHHGELESVIYVVSGRACMRWGERLEYVADAGPGDFIYVPPYVPHQEMNASPDEPLVCVLVRNNQEPIVVKLTVEGVEAPERVSWVDPHHPSE